ncbi:stellacyanin-like [Typha latifolia]|uniref:stellacyanin-like n=1 Tax=Typha latifolia TaxID=4733 RepID=UPI003C30796D
MAKLLILYAFVALSLAVINGDEKVYSVGDSAGWDISADFPSWITNKTFYVGDVLSFQYSKYHTVNEVDKSSYDSCNISSALLTGSDGNTSVPLTTRGDRYFVCGVITHCLGGMKLQVHVDRRPVIAPAGAPQSPGFYSGAPSPLAQRPFTKSDDPNSFPSLTGSSSRFATGYMVLSWSCALLQVLYWCLL